MKRPCVAATVALILVSSAWVWSDLCAQGFPPPNVVLGEGYAMGPAGWIPLANWPVVGTELRLVGRITSFEDQMLDVPAPSETLEYTYTMNHLTVQNTDSHLYIGLHGGPVRVYADTSPDADFLNPESFEDGDVVLEGICTRLDLWLPFVGREFSGFFVFSEGPWFSQLRGDRDHLPVFIGGQFACCNFSQDLQNYGYVARAELGMTFLDGVAVEATTWSRIKALLGK